jgi:hypothetical protein
MIQAAGAIRRASARRRFSRKIARYSLSFQIART